MAKPWISIAGVVFFLLAVFCVSFVFFYNRAAQRSQAEAAANPPKAEPDPSKSLINKPLPPAELVDVYGSKVDEQVLRKGRVVLVFVTPDCDACASESKFLQTLLDRKKDVTFYGLVPFGERPESPEAVEKMFPFKIFYDEANAFVGNMGINRVPVKVFLEDGIIKKGWIGATLTDKARASFTEWLDSLP